MLEHDDEQEVLHLCRRSSVGRRHYDEHRDGSRLRRLEIAVLSMLAILLWLAADHHPVIFEWIVKLIGMF